MKSLVELFVSVDDSCTAFLPKLKQQMLASGTIQRQRARSLTIMNAGHEDFCPKVWNIGKILLQFPN